MKFARLAAGHPIRLPAQHSFVRHADAIANAIQEVLMELCSVWSGYLWKFDRGNKLTLIVLFFSAGGKSLAPHGR